MYIVYNFPIYEKGNRRKYGNHRDTRLFWTTFKIFTKNFPSRVTVYGDGRVQDYKHAIQRNKSTAVKVFCILQVIGEYTFYLQTLKKAKIWMEEAMFLSRIPSDISTKQVMLVKMCLNKSNNKTRTSKHACIQNGVK